MKKKTAFSLVMTFALFLALAVALSVPGVLKSQDTPTAQPAKVALTCGDLHESIDAVSFQEGFRYVTVRARVYWKRCWTDTGAKYINPIAVRGGYAISDGGCGDNLRVAGYRFNFGELGGYNLPSFLVDRQGDCGNSRTINIEDESHLIPAYTIMACWNAHTTQVWYYANDIETDLGKCINY